MSEQQVSNSSREERDRTVQECISNSQKRLQLNAAMSHTIASEVYDSSLARALLMPRIINQDTDGSYRDIPAYQETKDGPVVMANLVCSEDRILHCRAYRDVVREEETVKTVRELQFLAIRGQAVRPASFPLSNVATTRFTELARNAYSLVERARSRMLRNLAQDETRLLLRLLAWACTRFGSRRWVVTSSLICNLERMIRCVGVAQSPVVLCSLNGLRQLMMMPSARFCEGAQQTMGPIAGLEVDGQTVPIYVDLDVPSNVLYVVPSGDRLGQIPIFFQPNVVNYDKPERLIVGWLVAEEIAMVLTSPRLVNAIHFGRAGLRSYLVVMLKRFWWDIKW